MGSNLSSISALLLGTLSISALHALIPSHWLAFALVGRTQRWSVGRTLGLTALAGTGHLLMTVLLGLAVATFGKALARAIPPQIEHLATAVLLMLLGLYFLLPALLGQRGCRHHHEHAYPMDADAEPSPATGVSQRIQAAGSAPTVMGILVMGMTLSPCLDLLAIFVPAFQLSWPLLMAVGLTMFATTLGIMLTLVWLTMRGMERLNLGWLERNEGQVIGGLLIALGALLLVIKT